MKKITAVVLVILFMAPFLGATAKKRGLTAEDFYAIKEVSDVQISPDSRTIAYVQKKIIKEKNTYSSNIWIISVRGGSPRQLTFSQAVDKSPRWSPDSKYLAFVSNRSGKDQIWLIRVDGGEAWTLTNMENGAWNPVWSPDATQIAFLSKSGGKQEQKKDRYIDEAKREYATDVRVIRRLRYRQGTSYLDEKRTHIWTIPVNGGEPIQITGGDTDDHSPVWSPDSKFIAFVSNRCGDPDFDDDTDICLVPAKGGEIKILTRSFGREREPVWSPNGKYIAYIGNTQLNHYTEQPELWVIPEQGGNPLNLTASFDRIPSAPQWSNNGKTIYFRAADQGNIHVFSVPSKGGKVRRIIGGRRQVTSYRLSRNGKTVAFIASENTNPSDVFVASSNGKKERQLTHVNAEFFRNISLVEPVEVWYKSYDGKKIHGWIMKPVDFDQSKKYPLIVEIHGGPYWYYGNVWFQEFQIMAARGYVVFYCNPRVSTGYGQDFAASGRGQWGEGDYRDIMRGVDYVLQLGFVDSSRMGITGGSYGGFMTNWIIGHTQRFKAAVTQRSLSNLLSFYGTTDIQNFIEFEFGPPWKSLFQLLEHSPINYIDKINTPLLIIHAELDYRVPISQAEELFVGLKRRGVEVEFVRYPREGHELSRSGEPLHRVDRYNRILGWFDKYLKR